MTCVRAEFGTYAQRFVDRGYIAIGWLSVIDRFIMIVPTQNVLTAFNSISHSWYSRIVD